MFPKKYAQIFFIIFMSFGMSFIMSGIIVAVNTGIADGFVNADILSAPKIDHSEALSLATEDEFKQPETEF